MVTPGTHRQYDVFRNPFDDWEANPYLIILQSDRTYTESRVVAPLVSPRTVKWLERLFPQVIIEGEAYSIAMPNMMAISTRYIGQPVANLETERYRIVSAIDIVFTGI